MSRESNEDTIVFTDKMSLSQILRDKTFKIIHQYSSLYSKLRRGLLTEENIKEDDDWQGCWLNILEFYFAVEADYLGLLGQYEREGFTSKEIIAKYKEIVNNYIKLSSNLKLSELDFVFDCSRYLASIIGLMSIDYRKKWNEFDLLKPEDSFEFVEDIMKEDKKADYKKK